MNRSIRGFALLFAALPALLACGPKQEAPAPAAPVAQAPSASTCELRLFIWSEYIDPAIVADFEKQSSCRVSIETYEDNEEMLARMTDGGASRYDLVVPSTYVVPVMVQRGLLASLDHARLSNFENLDKRLLDQAFDPGNAHTVPYQWGTVGILLRKSEAKSAEPTWGLIFDPAQQPGSFLLLDSYREMYGVVARAKGIGVNTVDPKELETLRATLAEAKARSRGFDGGVGAKNQVLAKSVTAAIVYNGDAVRGMADDPDTEFFVPKEGTVLWVDSLAITAQAPNPDAAYRFVDFILDAHVGARLSNFNQYATPNWAAREFVNKADLDNPAIYPSAEIVAASQFVTDLGEANKRYDEIWAKVKTP